MVTLNKSKPSLKFHWSHQSAIHRGVVKFVNKILYRLPFKLKYGVGKYLKNSVVPYSLLKGKTVIQVGAPYDTLKAGRSRGMYFSLFAGKTGRVLIIEPLGESAKMFENTLRINGVQNTTVHQGGAWSESGESYINVDLEHPATNYTGETVDYSTERKMEFRKEVIQLSTLDQLVEQYDMGSVDLVSLTTNWAEKDILAGMTTMIERGVKYICLAYGKDNETYESLMNSIGYEVLSHDDRGVTFIATPK